MARSSYPFPHVHPGRSCLRPSLPEVASMSDAVIACSNLSFARPDDTPVFRDLSFTMTTGRTGPVAPNGAGKTTLLRLLTGELAPDGGEIKRGDGRIAYLSQRLDNLLARSLFRGARAHRPSGYSPTANGCVRLRLADGTLQETGAPAV
ncbi:hypothetical protein GCM10010339_77400 [Streptomyces alanosinicus]|uniref:ABC transporter domain-containing protein n=1 Tax=Streptomyces alanosinicus TaxID=68171 RepID=A0A919D7C8_9ACTN|nr:hypothetical protein GCM10010339_77400 [Streptomyces alanosinicus]